MKKYSILFLALPLIAGCTYGEGGTATYTLKFDANGGSVSETTLTVNEGKTTTLPTPEKEGKTFEGWYTGWTKFDFQVDSNTPIYQNYDLIAKWDSYNLTYLNPDGTVFEVQSVKANTKATPIEDVPAIPEEGGYDYKFDGWDFDFETVINKDYRISPKTTAYKQVRLKTKGLLNSESEYDLPFAFAKGMFDNNKVLNADLAKFCFGLSFASRDTDMVNNFINQLDIDNIVFHDYDKTEANSIGYCLFHMKDENNKDLVILAFRGFNYDLEWMGNFDIGESGNHAGFAVASEKAYSGLKEYIQKYENPNILITGFSRAGGVSNMLSSFLMERDNGMMKDNLFTYTFECPRGLTKENAKAYPNVFNIINSADLITSFVPEEYGLFRCGTDIDIYSTEVDKLLYEFDKNIPLPEFKPAEGKFNKDQDVPKWAINKLMEKQEVESIDISTREHFAKNLTPTLQFAMKVFFSMSDETKQMLIKRFTGDNMISEILNLLGGGKDAIKALFKEVLDTDHIPYTEDELENASTTVYTLVSNRTALLADIFLSLNSFKRMVYFHFPELAYVLMNNYFTE